MPSRLERFEAIGRRVAAQVPAAGPREKEAAASAWAAFLAREEAAAPGLLVELLEIAPPREPAAEGGGTSP
jgi:hypothetical protein